MSSLIYIGLLAGGLLLCLLLIAVMARRYKELAWQVAQLELLSTHINRLEQRLDSARDLEQQTESSLGELSQGLLVLDQRILQLEQGLDELEKNQPNPEELEPERRMYRRAVRMIELGADLDEIMQECELPRAEAELLMNLHRPA